MMIGALADEEELMEDFEGGAVAAAMQAAEIPVVEAETATASVKAGETTKLEPIKASVDWFEED